ncbi:hypothetical protein CLU79DRAFT_775226 [Phycomyces nitens]|nr:hypothetical protein CLU79DRAFT_775226 [Phycomyces nitens]
MSDNITHGSIGYSSYQQQYPSTAGFPANDLASIILFFSIIFVVLASFVFYFWFTQWHKVPPQQRHEEELEHQKEVDLLVENLKQQAKTTFKIPFITLIIVLWKSSFYSSQLSQDPHAVLTDQQPMSHEYRKVFVHRFTHLFSIIFMTAMAIALAILIGTVSTPVASNTSSILQAGLFVFVVCINLFFTTRQRFYYKDRKEVFGEDDAHINAVYKTQFKDWDSKMLSNWIQIAILTIEFFQLLTFPLRDLITVNSFEEGHGGDQTKFTHLVSLVMNAGGFMPDMRTPTWYTYSVWTAFAATIVSFIVAVVVHCVNIWRPYKLPTRWVRWCIPVATLLYIPVLTTFVSSAACQSLNISTHEYAANLRCNSPQISQQVYLWMSLVGYVLAYLLMTIFLTSYERIPQHNEIAFKSVSVAFIKNMGLLLAIVFLLVESTTNKNRMRAIMSITILLTMICYNIKTKPCYVDKINFFRTASFSCILWASVLVAILSDTNAAQSLGPLAVLCIIVGGWAIIIFLFILIYIIYYRQPAEYTDDDRTDSGIMGISEDEPISNTPWAAKGKHRISEREMEDTLNQYYTGAATRTPKHTFGNPSKPDSHISFKESINTSQKEPAGEGWVDWAARLWQR